MKTKIIFLILISSLLFSATAGFSSTSITRTVSLQFNQMYVISFSGSKGESLQLNYTVISGGPVDFIAFNESNYNLYINGWLNKNSSSFTYRGELSAINTTHSVTTVTINTSQTYYLVIENSDYFNGGASATGPVTVFVSIHNNSTTPGFEFGSVLVVLILTSSLIALKKRKHL